MDDENKRVNVSSINIKRVIALWAFSEAALGGILHAIKIPFTGLIIGSTSVFCISLIAQFSNNKNEILKALVQVVLVKAIVSPLAPLNSYFALCLQGLLGFIFFKFIPYIKPAALLLGGIALALSAMQKFLVMTILFGATLWESFDSFTLLIIKQIPFINKTYNFSFSLILIIIYTLIHCIAGIYIAAKSLNVEVWLIDKFKNLTFDPSKFSRSGFTLNSSKTGKKKKWWQRPSGVVLIIISLIVMAVSYIFPNIGKSNWVDILIMLFRSIAITILWFSLISPILIKAFKKFIEKQRPSHSKEIESITELFPNFKAVVIFCWEETSHYTGLNRVRVFLSQAFVFLLLIEF